MKTLKFPLSWQILLAGLTASIFGVAFPNAGIIIGNLGTLYIKILELILIPVVISGIISGVSQINNAQTLGRLAIKNIMWFVASQIMAVFVALVLANIFAPGNGADLSNSYSYSIENTRNFGDFLAEMIPNNFFNALTNNNLSAIIIFGVTFGFFTTLSKDKSRIFLNNFFNSASEVMIRIASFVGRLAPIGIFGLAAKYAATIDFISPFSKLWPLILIVFLALAIHTFISLPIFTKIIAKIKPFRLLKSFGSVLFTSFGISSANVSIPLALARIKNEIGVSSRIADFSLPFGGVINFNGTSIYLCIASLFVAQAYGISIPISEQIILAFAVSFVAVGTTNIPINFTIMMIPVLEYLGVPIEGIGLIVICDVIFSMFCSFVDMWSNICATVSIARSEGETLNLEN
ncbi:MAG: dicarboxylate/amino acid:cation symporter [Bacteroidales bacterium]|nr:dicarboxylate/amino acid:cation symporter [Bacteroidales bacterium]